MESGSLSYKLKYNLLEFQRQSILELTKSGASLLKDSGLVNPFKESLLFMSYALKMPLEQVILNYENKIDNKGYKIYAHCIKRRAKKEPFAYITGKKEFYSLEFFVNKHVLIPRPETETLVSEGLKEIDRLKGKKKKVIVIDLGTGSGAIAVSLAKNANNVFVYAADKTYRVLKVADKNIRLNNIENRVRLVYFDILNRNICWYNETMGFFDQNLYLYNFDIIISNPPYIRTGELKKLDPGVGLYEPLSALDGGADGLKFYKKIFDIVKLFKKSFSLLLEIDAEDAERIENLYKLKFQDKDNKIIEFIKDMSDRIRVVKITYEKNGY